MSSAALRERCIWEPGQLERTALVAATGPPQVDPRTGEPHSGAMIALVPADPAPFLINGGETADGLHLTLRYLGDSDDMPDDVVTTLKAEVEQAADQLGSVAGRVFGAAVWNASGDEPCLVLSVGDEAEPNRTLNEVHLAAMAAASAATTDEWAEPDNHSPWVAHVALLYADVAELHAALPLAAAMEGPIQFDRLRLALGGESWDYPLGGADDADTSGSMSTDTASVAVPFVTAPEEATMATAPTAAPAPPVPDTPTPDEDGNCPDGWVPDGDRCVEEAEPDAAAEAPLPPAQPGEHLRAVMHVQGTSTGDGGTGRMFMNTTYRETPFAFHWSKESSAHGGMPNVVHVGNVVRVVAAASEGAPDVGFITLDLESEDGREYARRSVAGFERWVSIGLDETKPTVTVQFPEEDEDDESGLAFLFEEPDLVTVDGGRVGELTGVSVPAQADAEVAPTDELVQLMLGTEEPNEEAQTLAASARRTPARPKAEEVSVADTVQALTAAAYTITIEDVPPAWWYSRPTDVDLSEGALNVTQEGRLYGALAPLGVNHRAFARAGRRQEVPTSRVDYARFMGGWALTQSGKVPAGPITMDCGHAARFRPNGEVAPAHYENSCTVVGKIAVGFDRDLGVVWAAGALEPAATPDLVSRMLACRLSGDWQPHSDRSGWTELIAALLVPSPGFPMAHGGAAATYQGDALVASSVPVRAVGPHGRPRLRVDLTARTVERVATHSTRERFRQVAADVRAGRPVVRRTKGCCD